MAVLQSCLRQYVEVWQGRSWCVPNAADGFGAGVTQKGWGGGNCSGVKGSTPPETQASNPQQAEELASGQEHDFSAPRKALAPDVADLPIKVMCLPALTHRALWCS